MHAEKKKSLFSRSALKTKGNTPKYGLIFHSSFIGKAAAKNKGRISRYLANKCSIASRIDCFSEQPTTKFGDALKSQVDDRLEFFETGKPPAKNIDVMHKVIQTLGDAGGAQSGIFEDFHTNWEWFFFFFLHGRETGGRRKNITRITKIFHGGTFSGDERQTKNYLI